MLETIILHMLILLSITMFVTTLTWLGTLPGGHYPEFIQALETTVSKPAAGDCSCSFCNRLHRDKSIYRGNYRRANDPASASLG